MNPPEKLAGAIFLGLGWTAGTAEPAAWVHAGIAPALLLLAGGVLYTAGAISYYRRWPDPLPVVFGFHEVFHAYVCAGRGMPIHRHHLAHPLNSRLAARPRRPAGDQNGGGAHVGRPGSCSGPTNLRQVRVRR